MAAETIRILLASTITCLLVTTGCSQHYEEGASPPPKQRQAAQLPAGHPPVDGASPGLGSAAAPSGASEESVPDGAVTGTVRLAPELADHVPDGAVLFLIARERPDGGPPYAVKRIPVPDFPYTFTLSQNDVIPMFGEGLQFSDIPEMYIGARIDQDGRVGASSAGDMEGALKTPVAAGETGLEVLIDTIH